MVRQTLEGKGTTLEEALYDLYQTAREVAGEQGFVLPSQDNLAAAAVNYRVSVRQLKKGYVAGKREANPDTAFQSALARAGIEKYDADKHRVKVAGVYDLQRATVEKGQPSGAAPPRRRYSTGVEDTLLY